MPQDPKNPTSPSKNSPQNLSSPTIEPNRTTIDTSSYIREVKSHKKGEGGKVTKKVYFSHVKEAREAIRDKALAILEDYLAVVKAAQEAGDFEVATQSLQWLMEHMPEEDGAKMIEPSIDKTKPAEALKSPVIQIGFAIGGVKETQALPPEVIDIEPLGPPRKL